jgi:hypothetical protein
MKSVGIGIFEQLQGENAPTGTVNDEAGARYSTGWFVTVRVQFHSAIISVFNNIPSLGGWSTF